jgi:hypothetical protein
MTTLEVWHSIDTRSSWTSMVVFGTLLIGGTRVSHQFLEVKHGG